MTYNFYPRIHDSIKFTIIIPIQSFYNTDNRLKKSEKTHDGYVTKPEYNRKKPSVNKDYKTHINPQSNNTNAAQTKSAVKTPKRKKINRHINKVALAEYFDNIHENEYIDARNDWYNSVAQELIYTEQLHETIQDYKLSQYIRTKLVQAILNKQAQIKHRNDMINEQTVKFIIAQELANMSFLNRYYDIFPAEIYDHTMTTNDKINANILDKFERHMQHTSQARGMKKMHDPYKLRQKQR